MQKNETPLENAALFALAEEIAASEAPHVHAVQALRLHAEATHQRVIAAIDSFHQVLHREGAWHLRIEVSSIEQDRKDYNAWQFQLQRGRWRGLVLHRLPDLLRLVGPFREGEEEGPCLTCSFDESERMDAMLSQFLVDFARAAFDPAKKYRRERSRKEECE